MTRTCAAKKGKTLMTDISQFRESASFIRVQYPHPIKVVAILGSGLGDMANRVLLNPLKIPYADIPFFPRLTVEGHYGNLFLGELRSGVHMAVLQGRVHYYEGQPMPRIMTPLQVLRLLGAEILLVTNSAGGINTDFAAGDLMLIEDHINMMGTNPLIGENIHEFGPRFPDMSEAYSEELRKLTLNKAEQLNIPLQRGVYCAMTGPSYETPAEIRMLRTLGADAVGMSTVPEVIAANHLGMKVLGVSCVTNAAAGVRQGHRLSHQEVLEAAEKAKENFSRLLEAVLTDLPVSSSTANV
jgi:purine-nucleoside phosphorylase